MRQTDEKPELMELEFTPDDDEYASFPFSFYEYTSSHFPSVFTACRMDHLDLVSMVHQNQRFFGWWIYKNLQPLSWSTGKMSQNDIL